MKFIVFEGLDGAGKSTLMRGFLSYLEQNQIDFEQLRDPGGTPLGDKVRSLILDNENQPESFTELLLYQASRSELVHKKIRPALESKWVICDRYISSTVAFQSEARGIRADVVSKLNDLTVGSTLPDLVVYVDVTVDESQKRLANRTTQTGEVKDRMEAEDIGFHQRVRQGYLDQAATNSKNWLVLDGACRPDELLQLLVSDQRVISWIQG